MKVTVLGSTGSIGTQALDVVRGRGWTVEALAAGRNLALLAEQVREFRPALVSVEAGVLAQAREALPGVQVIADPAEAAVRPADVVVNAMSGLIGLPPTRAALEAGRAVALATKEAMVTAGHLMWDAAGQGGGRVVPVDSEHTGVYQCLVGEDVADVSRRIPITPDLSTRMEIDGEPLDPAHGLLLMLSKPTGVTCSSRARPAEDA